MNNAFKKLLDEHTTREEADRVLGGLLTHKFDVELRRELAADLQRDYQVSKGQNKFAKPPRQLRSRLYYALAFAAGLAALIFAGNFFFSAPTDARALATGYLAEADIRHSGNTKGGSDVEGMRRQAIQAFNAGQYLAATQYFDQLPELTAEDQFYSGMASLYQKQYDTAVERLQAVARSNSNYQAEAAWFLAVAHILSGNDAAAAAVLRTLEDSSWNQDQVRTLRRALE